MASYKETAMNYRYVKWSAEKTIVAINEFCTRHDVTIDKVGIDVFWEDCYLLSDPSKRDPMRYLYWQATDRGVGAFAIETYVTHGGKN